MHGQERASTKYGNAGPGASHRPHAHLRGGLQLSGRSDGHVHNRSWFFSRRHGREGWHETDQGNEDSHEATLPSQGFPVTGSGHRVSRHTRCTCRWQNPAYSPGRGVVFGEWPDVGPCTTCVTERSVRQEGILRKYVVTFLRHLTRFRGTAGPRWVSRSRPPEHIDRPTHIQAFSIPVWGRGACIDRAARRVEAR